LTATIESDVSLLRSRLDRPAGRRLIVTEPGGYRLSTDELEVGVDRFDALLRAAAAAGVAPGAPGACWRRPWGLMRKELLADEPGAKRAGAGVGLPERCVGLSDPLLTYPRPGREATTCWAYSAPPAGERAVLFGVCGGGKLCIQLAADHPDRVAGLIPHNAMARMLPADDLAGGAAAVNNTGLLAARLR
jgi:hypothetical protein